MLSITFDQLMSQLHTSLALEHLKNVCSTSSSSAAHMGHKVEMTLIPLRGRLHKTGSLSCFKRQTAVYLERDPIRPVKRQGLIRNLGTRHHTTNVAYRELAICTSSPPLRINTIRKLHLLHPVLQSNEFFLFLTPPDVAFPIPGHQIAPMVMINGEELFICEYIFVVVLDDKIASKTASDTKMQNRANQSRKGESNVPPLYVEIKPVKFLSRWPPAAFTQFKDPAFPRKMKSSKGHHEEEEEDYEEFGAKNKHPFFQYQQSFNLGGHDSKFIGRRAQIFDVQTLLMLFRSINKYCWHEDLQTHFWKKNNERKFSSMYAFMKWHREREREREREMAVQMSTIIGFENGGTNLGHLFHCGADQFSVAGALPSAQHI
ncbi:hypothetical protein LXL04_030731 [Taraxacum kok-saghyz]